MDLYSMLDLAMLAGPLSLSFDRKVAFYRRWPSLAWAIAAIVASFGLWDAWMASKGIWSFNPAFAGDARLLGLPPGEWLFFVVVPYACVFILACVRAYVPDRRLDLGRAPLFLAAAAVAAALALSGLGYTSTVLVSVAAALLLGSVLSPETLRSRNFWLAMAVSYLPFAIANGILTGRPVVLYDDAENLGLRIGTIPVEDFAYSFSMLAIAMVIFDAAEARRAAKKRATLGARPEADAALSAGDAARGAEAGGAAYGDGPARKG